MPPSALLHVKLIRGLQHDHNALSQVLYRMITSPDEEEIMALPRKDLFSVMDALQALIDEQHASHRLFERFLKKMVMQTGILPPYLFVSGVRRIGKNPVIGGGFADVWRGKIDDKAVAVKVLRIFGWSTDGRKLYREFCKEAMIWRQLNHENVLPFYGVCTDEFSPQYAMVSPWMENGNMMTYLSQHPDIDRLKLLEGVTLGLHYLHSLEPQVIHGDLRGANILIHENGKPLVADFGLSRVIDSQGTIVSTSSHKGRGHVRWHAPELIDVTRFEGVSDDATAESDVYALACVYLEIFTGEVPFSNIRSDGAVVLEIGCYDRRPPRPLGLALQRGLDDRIWSIMEDCWKTQPAHRPNMETLVHTLLPNHPRRPPSMHSYKTLLPTMDRTEIAHSLDSRIKDLKGLQLTQCGDLVLDDAIIVHRKGSDDQYHIFLFSRIVLLCLPSRQVSHKSSGNSPGGLQRHGSLFRQFTSLLSSGHSVPLPHNEHTSLSLKGRILLNSVTSVSSTCNDKGRYLLKVSWKDDHGHEDFTLHCQTEDQCHQWETEFTRLMQRSASEHKPLPPLPRIIGTQGNAASMHKETGGRGGRNESESIFADDGDAFPTLVESPSNDHSYPLQNVTLNIRRRPSKLRSSHSATELHDAHKNDQVGGRSPLKIGLPNTPRPGNSGQPSLRRALAKASSTLSRSASQAERPGETADVSVYSTRHKMNSSLSSDDFLSPISRSQSSDSLFTDFTPGTSDSQFSSQFDFSDNAPFVKARVFFSEGTFTLVVPLSIEHTELLEKIEVKCRTFGHRQDATGPLQVKFMDEDGHKVTIGSTKDVNRAFDTSRPGQTVALFVQ